MTGLLRRTLFQCSTLCGGEGRGGGLCVYVGGRTVVASTGKPDIIPWIYRTTGNFEAFTGFRHCKNVNIVTGEGQNTGLPGFTPREYRSKRSNAGIPDPLSAPLCGWKGESLGHLEQKGDILNFAKISFAKYQ